MEQLINFIIRPPRAEYVPENDLLDQEFSLKGKRYQRKDLEVVNGRGDVLQCSHYVPIVCPEGNPLPCVIYCHGNSGCRTDASEAAIILLPSNITVFTLDFSGSGLSGGEHVTLGWNEKDDLKSVVDYLRADGNVSLIGLWGRSMGSVTSLMYGAEDPSIAGMVLDSPFSDLVDLMMELVDTYGVRLPKFTVKFAIQYMRKAIQKKAKFDIVDLNTVKVAKSCFVPALFGHAIDDDFIQPHHSDRIFEAYVGDKNIIKFEGDHNSPRPQFYFDSISIFFNNMLQPPENEIGNTYFDFGPDYIGRGSRNNFYDMEYPDQLLDTSTGPANGSTEDAIRQLRSRRPMSMIVVPADISSKDKQADGQVENSSSDSQSSSSNMISYELSNGSPSDPHVPVSLDDSEYVEYSFNTLADFPSNAEEEERMLMEAMLASLKDLDIGNSSVQVPPACSGSSDLSLETKQGPPQSTLVDSSSTPCNSVDATKLDLTSTSEAAKEHEPVSLVELPNTEEILERSSIPELPSQEMSLPNGTSNCNNDIPAVPLQDASGAAPCNDPREETSSMVTSHINTLPLGSQSSSEVDMGDRTKVTVKVEKNPTGNIMDGLLRRWDLFRNR